MGCKQNIFILLTIIIVGYSALWVNGKNQTANTIYGIPFFGISSSYGTESNAINSTHKVTNLPNIVLDGTNVVPLSIFKNINRDKKRVVGLYYSEQGGAEITLKIVKVNNELIIERAYREPGLEAIVKIYKGIKLGSNGLKWQSNLYGKFVDGGLLLLEMASGAVGIPDSMWIYYQKQRN